MLHDSPLPDAAAIDRFLAGEATPEEVETITYLMGESPDSGTQLATLRAAVRAPTGTLPSFDASVRAAAIVEYSVRTARRARLHSSKKTSLRSIERRTFRYYGLAITGLVATAGIFALSMGNMATRFGHSEVHIPSQIHHTGNGQRASLELPDGSQVTLAPASTISIDASFATGSRTVTVQGEAYFKVVPNAGRPFTVNAGNAIVRVLGTEFNVRKYSSDSAVTVAVAEGRISLRPQNETGAGEAILSAATVGIANDSGQIVVHSRVDVDEHTGWMHGRIRFRDVPLHALAVELSRLYDVDITVSDSALASQRVTTGVATSVQSVTDVLNELMLPLNAHYVRDGRNVTIRTGSRRVTPRKDVNIPQPEMRYGR